MFRTHRVHCRLSRKPVSSDPHFNLHRESHRSTEQNKKRKKKPRATLCWHIASTKAISCCVANASLLMHHHSTAGANTREHRRRIERWWWWWLDDSEKKWKYHIKKNRYVNWIGSELHNFFLFFYFCVWPIRMAKTMDRLLAIFGFKFKNFYVQQKKKV